MEYPDVLLMLSGVSHPCPDCADDRIFAPADDLDDTRGAFCCTECGAALIVEIDIEVADRDTRLSA